MPDFQCTLWPDVWFGVPLTDCCIKHDLGGTHVELGLCVVNQFPDNYKIAGYAIGGVMVAGLYVFNPIYKRIKNTKE